MHMSARQRQSQAHTILRDQAQAKPAHTSSAPPRAWLWPHLIDCSRRSLDAYGAQTPLVTRTPNTGSCAPVGARGTPQRAAQPPATASTPAAAPAASSSGALASSPSGSWRQWPLRAASTPPQAAASTPSSTSSVGTPAPASAVSTAAAASNGRGRTAPATNGSASAQPQQPDQPEASTSASPNMALVLYRPPMSPIVWQAVGRVAGTAWTALKLCHRYVLVPAASWALRNIKAYIEEHLAMQRAMASTACPVPRLAESELRAATDNFSFVRRAVGSPFGLVVYLTRLRLGSGSRAAEREVAVRQMTLGSMSDVDEFWSEVAAGRALSGGSTSSTTASAASSASCHPNIVPYAGCCPSLTCHVYELYGPPYTCTLRTALAPGGPHFAALGLDCWEVRLAVCQQLVAAVAHLVKCGVAASDLSTAHVIVQPAEPPSAIGGGAGVQVRLAPGCGFRAPLEPPTASSVAGAGPVMAAADGASRAVSSGDRSVGAVARGWHVPGFAASSPAEGAAAGPGARVVVMARGLGQMLLQVLCGPDSPGPAPDAVLRALYDAAPSRLLSRHAAPPLTDEQAFPLLASLHPLLVWGPQRPGAPAGAAGGGGGGGGGGALPGGVFAADGAVALQAHLLREVAPALTEARSQAQRAAGVRRQPQATPPPPPPPVQAPEAAVRTSALPSGGVAAEDPFADASAPPLPPPPAGAFTAHPTAAAGAAAAPCAAPSAPPSWNPASSTSSASSFPSSFPAAAAPPLGPPPELLCPITQDLMDDPVVAADGHSYERAAVATWLAAAAKVGREPTSPLTGARLPHTALTPNYALRSIAREWRERHGS